MSRPQMVALIAVMFSGAIGITWFTDRTSKAYKIYKYIITVLLVAVFFLAVIFGKTP
jgi:TRAP-type C4-dicarboxylate transport system permease small subunit